jgi:hypothetical protein
MGWPQDKTFAFTVFDDTDNATIENVGAVYDFLTDLGFTTTKSVWPSHGTGPKMNPGHTIANRDYLAWLLKLRQQGFEIGYHGNSYCSSVREEIAAGIEKFKSVFGHPPRTMANHARCVDCIHWGPDRLTGLRRFAYNGLTHLRNRNQFRGHVRGDKHFWGDICQQEITYCRNFVYSDINTLANCPFMPYHDPYRPYVNYWFASSEGPDVIRFNHCLSEKNQDRLEREGGACIMYTHFALGFYDQGAINFRFKTLMKRLSQRNGWFVPVGTMLDYLRVTNKNHIITSHERRQIEWRWLRCKILTGTT